MRFLFVAIFALTHFFRVNAVGFAGDKLAVPAKNDQQATRTKLLSLFKGDYAKTSSVARIAFADKLTSLAAEETDSPTVRYVMLTEAIAIALKGGNVERAVRAAREIDHDFNDPELKNLLADAFAENIGMKDPLADFGPIAVVELATPTDATGQVGLGKRWYEAAKLAPNASRLFAVRRARYWLCEGLEFQDLKGLARLEALKICGDLNNEIENVDSKTGRFTLFEGKWLVKYENKYVHEYVISTDGSLTFPRGISPDGTPFVKKDEQKAKLIRRGGAVLVPFTGGTIIERFSIEGGKLVVERFDPGTLYPKRPNNKGEGSQVNRLSK